MTDDPGVAIKLLVDRWCERRDYEAIYNVLPAWWANDRMTDGWEQFRDALKRAYVMLTHLPADERDELKRVYVQIDVALRRQ